MSVGDRPQNSIRRWQQVLLIAVLWFVARSASAWIAPQYHHTAWSMENGAPVDIWALAQGEDGYLWLGTGTGLYRFDGVQFSRYQPPRPFLTNNVTALYIAPDGAIWIGFQPGGISVLRDGKLTHYGPADGAPTGMVTAFAQDRDGTLWAASFRGLFRFDGRRWARVGSAWSYPGARAEAVLVDSSGTLWVATEELLVYLPRGQQRFQPTGERMRGNSALAEASNGTIWLSDALHGTRPLRKGGARPRLPVTSYAHFVRMHVDRAGTLWGTTQAAGGVIRASGLERFDGTRGLIPADIDATFVRRDGLTSDRAVPILEDREGNIWVGTNLGLHRFRRNTVLSFRDARLSQQYTYSIAPGDKQELLVTSGTKIYSIDKGQLGLVADTGSFWTFGLVPAADGVTWVNGVNELWRLRHQKLEQVPMPAGLNRPLFMRMASDGENGVLAIFEGQGLYRFDGRQWMALGPGLVRWVNATFLKRSRDGATWIGYTEGTLARWDGKRQQVFSAREGLSVGAISAIEELDIGLVVAGEDGVAVLRDGTFRVLRARPAELLHGITGIVADRNTDIWLNGIQGVVRIRHASLAQSVADPRHSLEVRVFDFRDGLPGLAQQATNTPTAVIDSSGKLWFATNQGPALIDPGVVRTNTIVPPVNVRALVADGRRYPLRNGLRLPKGTKDVRIDFDVVSLSDPERAHARYRLIGMDDLWQDAGSRRQAFYTNLRPEAYRFQVIGANDSGLWNARGATLAFEIEPRFTQTWWFVALCILGVLGLMLFLYLLRLRQVADRLRLRLEERHTERERIARELHDTLLQGIQGLTLRFQAIANRVPLGDPIRTAIEQTLDRADNVIIEGRDRVRDLRTSPVSSPVDLAEAFARVGADLAEANPAKFRVVVEGYIPVMREAVRDEVYWIGREVLTNAFRHAHAKQIEVEISAGPKLLTFRFRDDGQGMDEDSRRSAESRGHWGLSGIRERAKAISAQLDIWSRVGSGTEVELTLPLKVARERPRTWSERLKSVWRKRRERNVPTAQ